MEQHSGSKGTHDFIADWVAEDFFFSKKDLWDRMGFLGVFCDYVLSCTQGAVAEIGCGESSIYLSHVARKFNRDIYHCDIAPDKILNPLTIPGYMTPIAIDAAGKRVEQFGNSHFFMGESDAFFEQDLPPLAFVFIDGDHTFEQAKNDFLHALPLVVDNGYILLHDTHPPSEDYLDENKCGHVYKLRQLIEARGKFDVLTLPRGTAMGVGLTIIRKKPEHADYYNE